MFASARRAIGAQRPLKFIALPGLARLHSWAYRIVFDSRFFQGDIMPARLTKVISHWLCALALGLSSTLTSAGAVLDRVVDSGTLRVAMSGDQAPFNMRNRDGDLMGMEVDLVEALASALNVELEVVTMDFAELLPALSAGKADMVVSGLAITADRSRTVRFAGPYMLSGKSILTTSQGLANAESTDELNAGKLKLAALAGSTSQQFVEDYLADAKLVKVADYESGVSMVRKGKVDALVADMPICVLSTLRYPDQGLMTLEQPISVEPIGIAVPASDPLFHSLVENYLDTFESTGMLNALRQAWLEDGEWLAQLPD